MTLAPLPYYGGKHPRGDGVGPWIARLLPYRRFFIEPFAGMGSVLLQRRPSTNEVLNDLDGRIICWWRAVRDRPDEFAHLVDNTPRSRAEFERALGRLDHDDPLQRALAVHCVVAWSVMHGLGVPRMTAISEARGTRSAAEIRAIHRRIKHVMLERMDAVELLERAGRKENAVVYCDPPYATADTSVYGVDAVDRDALTAALAACRGFVAISGYRDEWDHLGWERREFRTLERASAVARIGKRPSRTEVLWTSGPPVAEPGLFD